MSLKDDVKDLGAVECDSLIRCCFDTVAQKVLSALLDGDDAEAGRILRKEVEFIFHSEAEGIRFDETFQVTTLAEFQFLKGNQQLDKARRIARGMIEHTDFRNHVAGLALEDWLKKGNGRNPEDVA